MDVQMEGNMCSSSVMYIHVFYIQILEQELLIDVDALKIMSNVNVKETLGERINSADLVCESTWIYLHFSFHSVKHCHNRSADSFW